MGFEPTKPVWGLHDFQEDSESSKVVDIHRISHPHILVTTAEIDILILLVSGIYVTATVVFPSSAIVKISTLWNSQYIYNEMYSDYNSRRDVGEKKAGENPQFLMQVNS